MSTLYTSIQKLAGWIENGNQSFIDATVLECDAAIKEMMADGKQADVKETLMLAMQRMPKVMGYYMGKSCMQRGVPL